jgi:hypothetical protein
LSTGGYDICITQLDVLRGQSDGAQSRSADLVDAPCGGFDWQSGIDVSLTRWVLALACCKDLAQDGFVDF